MEENWKPITGYENVYQVSNLGRVRRIDRRYRVLSPYDVGGYLCVGLSFRGQVKSVKVHRLVAQAFLPNPGNLPCINHIDENPKNNVISNLEWCTVAYNNGYGSRAKKAGDSLRGKPLSAETRRKMSDAAKGRVNPMKGKHHSKETKMKISEAKRRCDYVSRKLH